MSHNKTAKKLLTSFQECKRIDFFAPSGKKEAELNRSDFKPEDWEDEAFFAIELNHELGNTYKFVM